jgi:hypothetical protein
MHTHCRRRTKSFSISPSKHIDFSLVHSKLADIRLQEEHIRALHAEGDRQFNNICCS